MRAADLGSVRVAVWGLGREGRAAIAFLRARHPSLPLVLLDDSADASPPVGIGGAIECAFGEAQITRALGRIDVVVKSPGVSLYRPEIETARRNGVAITSLLNLWFAEEIDIATICVTGTKGKSTTAALIAHILRRLGRKAALVGNIGIPITEIDPAAADYAVIEVSSYQAADFDGVCDAAVLTALYPEHLDWHRTLENYYRDKINLLARSRCSIVGRDAIDVVRPLIRAPLARTCLFNEDGGIHTSGTEIWDGAEAIGPVRNRYLARPHNRSNLCAALAAAKILGIGVAAALGATCGFGGLPHRQQELGTIGGLLFVDDSISTIPESTLAAMAVYAGHDIALIVGGYDRGIDYGKLVAHLAGGAAKVVICLGASGERIYAQTLAARHRLSEIAGTIGRARSMQEAVACAVRATPSGGVVLLSPAAPSYGYYRDFSERGRDFAAKAGFAATTEDGR